MNNFLSIYSLGNVWLYLCHPESGDRVSVVMPGAQMAGFLSVVAVLLCLQAHCVGSFEPRGRALVVSPCYGSCGVHGFTSGYGREPELCSKLSSKADNIQFLAFALPQNQVSEVTVKPAMMLLRQPIKTGDSKSLAKDFSTSRQHAVTCNVDGAAGWCSHVFLLRPHYMKGIYQNCQGNVHVQSGISPSFCLACCSLSSALVLFKSKLRSGAWTALWFAAS